MDDVHKLDQFQDLLPCASLLCQGSRILITSRDESVLKDVSRIAKVDLQIYEVLQLDWNESNVLFNWHAFHGYEVVDDFKNVAKDVVNACGGLPLALKVIGSSLSNKKSDEDRETIWPEAVDALRQRKDVMGVLRWSYDFLLDEEKCMFLDITCMFHNGTIEEALAYWRSCAPYGGIKTLHTSLKSLMDKNLIKKNYGGQLKIHDLIRDVGLEIGREAKSHLICNDMDDGIALARKGVEETMVLNLAKSRKRKFDASMFSNMPNLHHLILPNKCSVNGDLSCISELRRLQWREALFGCIPTTLSLIHLLELDFSYNTNLASLWPEANTCFEGCPNLRLLYLEGCTSITKLPDSVGQLKALENLNICYCTSLKALPDSLGLSNLTILTAYGCHSLLKLPTSIGQSSRLQFLSLVNCNSLEKLPKSIGRLHALERLYLRGCTSLKALPDTIGDLSNLIHLEATNCTSLVKIPYSSIGLLQSLEYLDIELGTECQGLADGNQVGTTWTQLRNLKIRNCDGLGFRLDYGAFKSLYDLELSDTTLTELPESLGLLTRLEYLTIYDCKRLQIERFPESFGDLKMLERLCLTECKSLRTLPEDWRPFIHLPELSIECCPIISLPEGISCLSQLRRLELTECKNMQKLPTSIRQLKCLEYFHIKGYGSIEAMGALTTLQGLPIWGSTSLTHLPPSLQMVLDLVIASCDDGEIDLYDFMSYEVLEEDESGYLRAYLNTWTEETTLVRRPHKYNIHLIDFATSSESDESSSD